VSALSDFDNVFDTMTRDVADILLVFNGVLPRPPRFVN